MANITEGLSLAGSQGGDGLELKKPDDVVLLAWNQEITLRPKCTWAWGANPVLPHFPGVPGMDARVKSCADYMY